MSADVRLSMLEESPYNTEISIAYFPPFSEIFIINNLIALPIHPVKKFVAEDQIYDIPVSFDGREIGSVCLLSQIIQSENTVSSLTPYQHSAYLSLAPMDAIKFGSWVPFGFDAIVLKENEFWVYFNNRRSSPLWGGFVELAELAISEAGRKKSKDEIIPIYKYCKARTLRHQECLELSSLSNDITDRFLHLYHYLELDYDYEIVREIKTLDEENPRGLWDVLKLQQADTDRLYHILKDYPDVGFLESLISKMSLFKPSALRIFYDYGKDSNPLKSEEAFKTQFLEPPVISIADLDSIKKSLKLSDDFAGKPDSYSTKLKKLACYWIYRFRCSIAHNKLGEYYLNRNDDIKFLAEFGEPLLIEMVRYRMTK